MKLMSLEEAQARSLSPNHPVHRERQRENSLPNTSTATLYHTVIDISDSKYDRFMFSPLRDDVITSYVLRSEQSVECLNNLFVLKEKVFWEIQEMEVHLQLGKVCGKGKTEPEWKRVHKSTRDR